MAKSKDMIDPLVVVWKTSERSNAKYKLKAFKGYHIDYFLKTDSKLPGLPEDAIILEIGLGKSFVNKWKEKYKIVG